MGLFPSHHLLSNLMASFNEKDYSKIKDKRALMQQHSNSIYSYPIYSTNFLYDTFEAGEKDNCREF